MKLTRAQKRVQQDEADAEVRYRKALAAATHYANEIAAHGDYNAAARAVARETEMSRSRLAQAQEETAPTPRPAKSRFWKWFTRSAR